MICGGRSRSPSRPTVRCSRRCRCSGAAASAGRRRSTRRWRSAPPHRTTRSGTQHPGSQARPASRSRESDLRPHLERVEQRLGVRERRDWQTCVHTTERGFRALGAKLEPVISYTDANCMRCGSCLQGCPTNAGKSTLNTYIEPAVVTAGLRAARRLHGPASDDRGSRRRTRGHRPRVSRGRRHRCMRRRPTSSSSPRAPSPHRASCCAPGSARRPEAPPAAS